MRECCAGRPAPAAGACGIHVRYGTIDPEPDARSLERTAGAGRALLGGRARAGTPIARLYV